MNSFLSEWAGFTVSISWSKNLSKTCTDTYKIRATMIRIWYVYIGRNIDQRNLLLIDDVQLEVGNGNLTTEECRSHFALWAIMKSPLLIGTDLTNLSQTNIDILQNKYILAFNQDPVYGKPAQPYKWVRSF